MPSIIDINAREMIMLATLALAVLAMGVYPDPFATVMHKSVEALIAHVQIGKLN